MMKLRNYIFVLVVVYMSSCSLSKYLDKGEYLYDGIKEITVTDNDKKDDYQQEAISQAKATLTYETNGFKLGKTTIPSFSKWIYMTTKNDSTLFGRILGKFGSPAIFLSNVNPPLRAKVAETTLNNYGYLSSYIFSMEELSETDSCAVAVSYDINTGKLYRCDSIVNLDNINIDSVSIDMDKISTLKKGDPFSVINLEKDRNTIAQYLRDHGFYYFRPDMIIYKADTTVSSGSVIIKKALIDGLPSLAVKPWKIGKINVRLMQENRLGDVGEILLKNTLPIDSGITLYYNNRPSVRKSIIKKRILMLPDSLYSPDREAKTLKALSALGAFSSSEFVFTPQDTANNNRTLDLDILLRPDRPWDVSLETLFKAKSNNYIGPGATASISKRNLFGGGETLSVSLWGSYEWQLGKSPVGKDAIRINSYQIGTDISLIFPTLLFPGKINSYFSYPTSTSLRIGASLLNRPALYTLKSLSFNMAYDFQPSKEFQHRIQPLSITYTLLGNTSDKFNELVRNNPSLKLSYRDQLIPQISYSFTYDNILNFNHDHHIWMRYGVSEAGNIVNGIMALAGKKYNSQKNLMGVHFAQFVKATAELRYTYKIDYNNSIATRFATGAVYSFGNSNTAPFMEELYVGGANSIRAYTVRSIGPGKFKPTEGMYSFMDQVGDFKLEGNLEYRMRIWKNLNGAVFLDAGNVWLINKDELREGGSLKEISGAKDFFNQIAVGTGVGLRYDLDYLVVRFDVGMGLHLPYYNGVDRWYNITNFYDSLGFHIAVGYPF